MYLTAAQADAWGKLIFAQRRDLLGLCKIADIKKRVQLAGLPARNLPRYIARALKKLEFPETFQGIPVSIPAEEII